MPDHLFPPGHIFFHSGDRGDCAYQLLEGQVELLAGSPENSMRVALCQAGDVFGEMALVEERPRMLTARAVTAGRATPMAREEFEHQLTNDPANIRQYLRALFERLRMQPARVADGIGPSVAETPPATALVAVPSHPTLAQLPPGTGKQADCVVVVHPLTRKAAQTLPDEGLLVTHFPLRIGRAAAAHEREALDLNDLWLLDNTPYNVSRNHCEIHADRNGPVVRDRGSHHGCYVNDEWIGGRARHSFARLEYGDNVLIVGSRMSPYQFRVTVRGRNGDAGSL